MKYNSKTKLIFNLLILVLIFGMMAYLLQNSLAETLNEISQTTPLVLFLILLLASCSLFFEGKGIQAIVQALPVTFTSFSGILTIVYSSFYRLVTFGAGTFISEINFYRKKNLKLSQGLGVTALHLVVYKLCVITLAFSCLAVETPRLMQLYPTLIMLVIFGGILSLLVVGTILLVTISLKLQVGLVRLCHRCLKSVQLREYVDRLNLQIYSLRDVVAQVLGDKTSWLKILVWHGLKFVAWFSIPYVTLVADHPDLNYLFSFALVGFAVLLASVIPTPAGLGSFEFMFLLLFKPIVGTVDAVSAMLLYRLATLVWPFFLGFIYVLIEKRQVIGEEIQEIRNEKKHN